MKSSSYESSYKEEKYSFKLEDAAKEVEYHDYSKEGFKNDFKLPESVSETYMTETIRGNRYEAQIDPELQADLVRIKV